MRITVDTQMKIVLDFDYLILGWVGRMTEHASARKNPSHEETQCVSSGVL